MRVEATDPDGMAISRYVTAEDVSRLEARWQQLVGRRRYTYAEVDPTALLGVATAIIPMPDRNQSPRNTYQCGMGKQALGVPHEFHAMRFDSLLRVMEAPQRALVESQMSRVLGLDEKPAGMNCITALLADPYNQEDSVVANKTSVECGMSMYTKYNVYTAVLGTPGNSMILSSARRRRKTRA